MNLYTLRFLPIMLILDFIYISFIGKTLFGKMINDIQKSQIKFSYLGAIMSYLFLSLAFYYFIISKNGSVFDAFILGIVIYGVFDFTSIALFKSYDLLIGILDTLWGGILFSLTAFFYKISGQ